MNKQDAPGLNKAAQKPAPEARSLAGRLRRRLRDFTDFVTGTYRSPYEEKSIPEIYEMLQTGQPHWPSEQLQKGYTGTYGPDLLKRAFSFTDILEKDGAFAKKNWRGLDYGCGWGRFASVLLDKGRP